MSDITAKDIRPGDYIGDDQVVRVAISDIGVEIDTWSESAQQWDTLTFDNDRIIRSVDTALRFGYTAHTECSGMQTITVYDDPKANRHSA